ncbi:MAG: Zn-dependent alcohol dehydrogenase [Paracoccaceae bacterium]|nr:Zn-dependent alcohol dehydrogenase [Paracoccaceae bacterium]
MRAAVLTKVNQPLEILELGVDAPRANEVLIRTATAGVCHSDMHFQEGKYPCECPTVLGHEAAGIVEAVGEDVRYVAPGDHVITCVSMSCGDCRQCFRGKPHLCAHEGLVRAPEDTPRLSLDGKRVHQFSELSCYAEQMLVHEKAVVKIDRDLPLDKAALLGCAVVTGVGAVQNTAKVGPGDTVAIVGCGGIGLNAIQGARIAGASRIVAVDMTEAKLAAAREFGATDGILATDPKPWARLREIAGRMADAVFVTVGAIPAFDVAPRYLAAHGRMVMVGMPHSGAMSSYEPVVIAALAQAMVGSVMGDTVLARDIRWLVDLYEQGRLKLDELISGRWSLDQINEAIADTRSGAARRNVIVF